MLNDSLYAKINLLPYQKMVEVMDFIDFLLSKEQREKNSITERRMPKFGCAKGKFKMAADFDAPLEDFNDYMP